MEKMETLQELEKHIKENKPDYGPSVIIAALVKKFYGVIPKIGLSGQQAEFVNELADALPKLGATTTEGQ